MYILKSISIKYSWDKAIVSNHMFFNFRKKNCFALLKKHNVLSLVQHICDKGFNLERIHTLKVQTKLVGIDWSLLSSPSYCHEFVNIVCTICIYYFFFVL